MVIVLTLTLSAHIILLRTFHSLEEGSWISKDMLNFAKTLQSWSQSWNCGMKSETLDRGGLSG